MQTHHKQVIIRTGSQMDFCTRRAGKLYKTRSRRGVAFTAVSKPNFASRYSLESSRRDLHNALLCNVL